MRARSQLLLFTQYDRQLHRPSELWHCALAGVVEAPDAPPRRSFEVRALVVLEEVLGEGQDRWRAHESNRPLLTKGESEHFCEAQARSRREREWQGTQPPGVPTVDRAERSGRLDVPV